MALNIKNAETEKLARELARRRKQSIAEMLTDVLRREVERERKKRGTSEEEFVARLKGIAKEVARLSVSDNRPDDEIIGYNEQGHLDRW
jgi:antitoxin VapB